MIRPPHLKAGDRIALVSTARKIDRVILDSAVEVFKNWGLDVIPGKHLFEQENQFAGSDSHRLDDLQQALDDSGIQGVLCARGGYGTSRIVDDVNWASFHRLPKWVMGYSDVCVLHGHIQHMGFQSLHCSMPVNFPGNSPESLEGIRKALFGEKMDHATEPHPFNRKGYADGKLVGGNLSILYSIQGTASMPPLNGNVLFLEDLDEYLYHIDRMMISLKRNGVFDQISGLVIGGMTDMNDNEIPFGKNAEEIIRDVTSPYDFPICFNLPSGHVDDNRPLIMGSNVELKVSEKGGVLSFSS